MPAKDNSKHFSCLWKSQQIGEGYLQIFFQVSDSCVNISKIWIKCQIIKEKTVKMAGLFKEIVIFT